MLRKDHHLDRLENYLSLVVAAAGLAAKLGAAGGIASLLGSSQELEEIEVLQTMGYKRDPLALIECVLERERLLKRLAGLLEIVVQHAVGRVAQCAGKKCQQFQSEKPVGSSHPQIDGLTRHDL